MALIYDPNKQIYAQPTGFEPPDMEDPDVSLGDKETIDSYIDTDKATVEGRTNNLVKNDNPLMQTARADAQNSFNSRGLLNSSMAGTAGTKAVLDKAVDIATPDAKLYGDMSQNDQKTDLLGLINTQMAGYDQKKGLDNATLEGAREVQNFGNSQKNAVLQGKIAEDFKEFSQKFDKEMLELGLDSNERISLSNSMTSTTNTLMGIIGNVLNNEDIEITDNTSSWVSDFMYSGWEALAANFGLDIQVT